MAKNNQKKEKALRNREYAKKFRKKPVRAMGRGRRPGGPGGPGAAAPGQGAPGTAAAPAAAAAATAAPQDEE